VSDGGGVEGSRRCVLCHAASGNSLDAVSRKRLDVAFTPETFRLFFDEQSGLLVRLVRYAETPLGRNPTQIDYADYRDAGGVKIPYRWTIARPAGRFTIQVDQVEQNVAIDDAKFANQPQRRLRNRRSKELKNTYRGSSRMNSDRFIVDRI
jgi:hypothetical protein